LQSLWCSETRHSTVDPLLVLYFDGTAVVVIVEKMSTVLVYDKNGDELGRIKVGDTKVQALERLSCPCGGGLFDSENVGLLNTDLIAVEGAPYVFKDRPGLAQQELR